MSDVNKAIVCRVVDDVWNKADLKVVDDLYALDFACKVIGMPEIRGREAYKDLVRRQRTIYPDLQVTADRIIAENDLAVLEWTVDGTQNGEMEVDGRKLPATGAKIHYSGLSRFRVRDGAIQDEMIMGDAIAERRQLGVLPDLEAVANLEKLGRDVIEELWNKGHFKKAEQFAWPEYVHHGPQGMIDHGPEGLKHLAAGARAAMPDLHFALESLICKDDQIVMKWSFKGTHQGEWLGVKPQGKPVMMFGTSISKVKDGKLLETWAYWDVLDLMHQMGAAQDVKVAAAV